MLKTEVSYIDLNGKKVTDTLFLHMSRIEMIKFLTRWGVNDPDNVKEEFTKLADRMVAKKDAKTMLEIIDDFLLSSYGKASEDGKRFIKNDEVREEFDQSLAHEALFDKFLSDPQMLRSTAEQVLETQSVHLVKPSKKPSDFKRSSKNRNRANKPINMNAAKQLVKDGKISPNA